MSPKELVDGGELMRTKAGLDADDEWHQNVLLDEFCGPAGAVSGASSRMQAIMPPKLMLTVLS